MEKYKINSSRLKSLIGYQLVLVNNYYSHDNLVTPIKNSTEYVIIDEAYFDENIGFTVVKCHNKCTDKHYSFSLRRNGVSINKNKYGIYEHYFNYENLNYIVVKIITDNSSTGKCTQEFTVPLSLKSTLISGIADVNKSVKEIYTSNEVYNTPDEAINSKSTFYKIY